ncbi:MAG: GNAT family N-acetyltransferase [Thiocapsa sp.]|uniref:GNAT family N-acetyltransferase n=1 Tax=Thiocapsa sp. TaxID=2024551 RepID=UPI001BCE18CA|nr:GNAT family N-acetyltransferase [Thiocapsa sp.]QVL50079.1 MAG: GNAT family N-acetyltransferase [Thiocapsa sp.]
MHRPLLSFMLSTPQLRLSAREAPWDTAVYREPVVQVEEFELIDPKGAISDYTEFQSWLDVERISIVGCRLAHEQLRESMFLEAHGFRFVEMVLHPRLDRLQGLTIPEDDLKIAPADTTDLANLQEIAECAFGHERYHVDPRLDPRLGDKRYGRWVRNSHHHPTQRLLKVLDGERLVGLFIVERQADLTVYWHLTAIAPQWQGRGYGRRVWMAMLHHHQVEGFETVTTTISARNIPVLNLYAKLQFRFMPPEMTFHWVRPS